MVSKLIRALKNEMKIKDMITWFILSFLCVSFYCKKIISYFTLYRGFRIFYYFCFNDDWNKSLWIFFRWLLSIIY